jgi:hypothetical protein
MGSGAVDATPGKAKTPHRCGVFGHGRGWIRTNEGISHQIYSLTRLAASVHARESELSRSSSRL